MRLTMNVDYYTNLLPTQEAASMISAAGFDSADYGLFGMADPANRFLDKDYLTVAEQIGAEMRAGGLPVTQTHAPFTFNQFADPDVYRDFILPSIVRSVEVSAALGADTIVVHPLHHMLYSGHEEELFRLNMDFYRALIPVAQSCGIKIAVENMFQRDPRRGIITHDTCSTIQEFCRYVDTLDSEYIVACLDIGHVGLPLQKEEAWDFIYALGHERLKALHIHDNNYKNDLHALPYTGTLDWDEITKALGKIDYAGDFTYEIRVPTLTNTKDPKLLSMGLGYAAQVGRYLIDKVEMNRPQVV